MAPALIVVTGARQRLERGDWDPLDLPGELIEHDTTSGDRRVDELVARLGPLLEVREDRD